MKADDTVLIYAINRTDAWWKHVGANLGFENALVVSDVRGAADRDVVDDFNTEYARQQRLPDVQLRTLTEAQLTDIIARCRLLRWLPKKQARCMVAAMEAAFNRVLDETQPGVVLSFPIDRYVSDVLERLAKTRGIPYVELTASLVSGMSMLMYRGQLIKTSPPPADEILDEQVRIIANPSFTPSYVQTSKRYTRQRWLKIFCYFRVRGWGFKLISWFKRDPCNLHYLDAQSFLGHKPRLRDLRTLDLIDWNWREAVNRFPKAKRVFFGLQLFPEASIAPADELPAQALDYLNRNGLKGSPLREVGAGGTAVVTREMIGAAHDVMLAKGDFVLSAALLERIYFAMEQASPPPQTPFDTCPTCEALARTVMMDQTGAA